MEKLAKKSLILLAMGVALTTGTRAQTATKTTDASAVTAPGAALPSADQVLKHYYEAIGGRAAWEKLHSRVSKGTIELPAMNNLSGTIEVHMKAPNSILVVINLGGAVIQQGFDGTTAWSDDPRNGLRVLAGGELEDEKREANFYHALDLQKIYSTMTVTGIEKIDDRDAYVIEATPASGGEPDKMYFDVQSGLEVRSMNHRHTADGTVVFQADIKDYKDVDGIKLPFSVQQSGAQNMFVIRFTDIQHNVNLADSQFAKPASEPAAAPADKQ